MISELNHFASIWCIVVAVETQPGERLEPIAIAAMDIATTAVVQVEMPSLRIFARPPYPIGPSTLIVTINAQLLAGCHLALGWRMPERVVDLMVECHNARPFVHGVVGGLAGALAAVGQPATLGLVTGTSPIAMRRRLDAASRLFAAHRATLDLGRGLLRGRYLCAVAHIETAGVPIDGGLFEFLSGNWVRVVKQVGATVAERSSASQGFSLDVKRGIERACRAEGNSCHSNVSSCDIARLRLPLSHKELLAALKDFDPQALAVGRDKRNRVPLRPFASTTGRNQPSVKASVLGGASWVRHLIRPEPGTGLVMLDWQQQEFGIAAALSCDMAMRLAYSSGDPYMALAATARAVPHGCVEPDRSKIRERFKRCAIGLQYGVGERRLAQQLGTTEDVASGMIDSHKRAFRQFWAWSDAIEISALMDREIRSVFGWRLAIDTDTNMRSIRNFPMQANGAEMLRLACCSVTENGIKVCAAIHDALLIEAPLDEIDAAVARTQRLMAEASAVVLDGFELRTSVRIVRAPDRWSDDRGQVVWSAIETILDSEVAPVCKRDSTCSSASPRPILLSHEKRATHAAD